MAHGNLPADIAFLVLAPGRQRVCMVETGDAFPEVLMVQECDHYLLKVISQGGQHLHKWGKSLRGFPLLSTRLFHNRQRPLLAPHSEDIPKLGFHRIA